MRSITITDISDQQYNEILDFLKKMKVTVEETSYSDYRFSETETKLMEDRLQYLVNNPEKLRNFDQSLDDLENEL
jgi:hypothetical protein